ncbi:galactomannan galactosyltransferase 1-like [Rhododendron vialii]|uniref:galactomannan galactosyltransferase 1-like n=1 Tax=Rhododendron vialii TaxID=182163 RepID=UPI00265D6ED7|nr:galactomannan galactosyltransferase 1-like [Rhododendron vialii]
MAKTTTIPTKPFLFLRDKSPFIAAAVASLLILSALWSFINPAPSSPTATSGCANTTTTESRDTTFYDDPSLSYSIGSPLKNWDEKRQQWLHHHPSFAAAATGVLMNRVVVVTGSQPPPCENPVGDLLLLRLFKNKVDYCRIQGHDIFYNNAFLHREMKSVWAKLPPVKAAMVAHPEAEWVLWLDSDAVVTDMEFKLPFEKYGNHNFVVNGWEDMIYEKRSWLGLNTGIFLIRNCQWSIDFIETWASLGPANPNHDELKEIIRGTLTDKEFPGDEQSALVYLMLKEKEKWGEKVYIENGYSFSGYWVGIVDGFERIEERYRAVEAAASGLRRRRGEAVSGWYGEMREVYLKGTRDGNGGWRRPFITHFTGCQPCSGHHDPSYGSESCWNGMERALNFADNQVLRNYGFVHNGLGNSSFVSPLQFDSPA